MAPEPGSPSWWLDRLYADLQRRVPEQQLMQRYADGEHDRPSVVQEASRTFRRLMGLSVTNLTGLIVEATAERQAVQGFRFGDQPDADADAWRIWQESDFDSASEMLITAALTVGRSFILVEPPQDGRDRPRLYAEDASQMVVAYEAGRRTERAAALKVWRDDWSGDLFATLYLPGSLHKMRARVRGSLLPKSPLWTLRDEDLDGERNPLGEVPVFELQNRPALLGGVTSEIADVLADQDRANLIALNIMIAMEYGAFPQKWATGLELPTNPETGQPLDTFEASVRRMWVTPSETAKFGALPPTDIKPYIDWYTSTVQHMAAVTRTPASYLLGHMANLSAEALAAAEAGLVNKVKRRRMHFEQAFESALRLAFRTVGDPRGDAVTAETVWVEPEIRSDAQSMDAAQKGVQGGIIAAETAQERYLGMTATERARDRARREEGDALGQFTNLLNNQAAPLEDELGGFAAD